MTRDDKPITLVVRFDVDQPSAELDWNLTGGDGQARQRRGPYAGAVHFHQGETLLLEVHGGGARDSGFTSFQILDCCILTRPQIVHRGPVVRTRYAPPSPFLQSIGGSYQFENDFSSSVGTDDAGVYRTVRQKWKRSLNICHTQGRWELSFNVTVRILRGQLALPELRVFQFDPEGQVGPGTVSE